ncbi:MAG: bifunctional pyr operon transcriptional regulator/uracil phosphoribosyltransferase PyrR [Bacteroidetes bacterium]|nr:bifunctional pyr operon transcriptional regulator/uracil phosphoribosyltransferase PyrR [Bacteroidota bacterium]
MLPLISGTPFFKKNKTVTVQVLVDTKKVYDTLDQLAAVISAANPDFSTTVMVGIQQGGALVSEYLYELLLKNDPKANSLEHGKLDITFYRDDVRNKILAPDPMHLPFSIEGKTVILVDDVLFTGRTIKAALDSLFDYGRPERVQLCVLVDRKEHRQFPIQPDYTGMAIPSNKTDKLKLVITQDNEPQVVLINQ